MTTFPVVAELLINGAWQDVSGRVKRAQEPTIKRGRSDESSDVEPTTTSLLLENSDGYLTPGNAASPWYPDIKRGLPMRLGVRAGTQSLFLSGLTGSRASTPDNAALDVTGDHFGALELQGPPTMGPSDQWVEVVSKYVASGNQRSWHLRYTVDGRLALFWSTDGTTVLSATSTRGVPVTSAGQIAFAWWLDVNNGAAGNTVTFYTGTSIDAIIANPTGSILGTPVVQSGTTSVFSSSAPVDLGDLTGTSDPPFGGRVRRFQFRSGDSTGSIVANPTFYTQTIGTTSFTDSAGRVWTLAGDAAITDKQYRFTGSVDSISLNWPKATPRIGTDRGVARATFTLSGALRRMQQGAKPLHSALWRIVTAPFNTDLVHAYWPMEDGRDSTSIASPIEGVSPMAIRGQFSLAGDDSLAASSPLLNIASGDTAYMAAPIPQTIDQVVGVKWEVTRFFRIDDPSTATPGTQLMAVDTNGRVATWRLFINDTQVGISGDDSDGSIVVLANFATTAAFYNTWAMIVLEVQDNGVNVDWTVTLIPIPLGTGFGTNGSFVGQTGVPNAIRNNMVAPPSGISTGHVIVTAGAPIGWLAGPDTAWVGETAAHRFSRLCSEEHICQLVVGDPNLLAGRGDPAYSTQMGPQRPLPLIDLLRECADADIGILYERRDCDGLAFRTRRSLYNQTAAVTLNTNVHAVDNPFEPILDDQRLRNDVTVTRPDGSSARVTDDASIAADGLYDVSVEANVYEDSDLPDQAGWRLHQGTWPEMRYPALATGLLSAGPAVQDQWLHSDLGDRVTLSNLMRQVDSTVDQLIEGYEETLPFFKWDVSATGSPEGVWEVAVRNDTTRGKRDTAGSELASSFAAGTATSMSVTITIGPLWTTAGGDFPFDLNVGNVRLTCTAISGGSSPQTFTITQTPVNGVTKTIPAGTAVKLWRPSVRAL